MNEQNMTMKLLNNKISCIFSSRSIICVIHIFFLNSCVSPTYPVTTHQGTYHPHPVNTHTISNPVVPFVAGAAAIGAIAYYGKKKHDDRKKSRVKSKPIVKRHIPYQESAYPSKRSVRSHPVTYRDRSSNYRVRDNSSNRSSRYVNRNQPPVLTRNSNRSNQRSTRTRDARRQRTISTTREQLIRERDSRTKDSFKNKLEDKKRDKILARDARRKKQS